MRLGKASIDAETRSRVVDRDEFPYRVVGVWRRTATIVEVWLSPLAASMQYLPGEYVLLEDLDGRVEQRSYSIANAQRSDGQISLLVTRVPGGQASEWIHTSLHTGDEVILTGPYGTFVADPASSAPCLYLAAGSGLAPMRALLEGALQGGPWRSLTLIFSARTEADVLDRELFVGWEAAHPDFRFIRTLTRGAGGDPHGRIPAILPELCPELSGQEVFIAGASGFVRDCAITADALGAERERTHTEPFFAEPQAWSRAPLGADERSS
jgi:CDP-4-dehydro-6-deoxyglucose reductase, E3